MGYLKWNDRQQFIKKETVRQPNFRVVFLDIRMLINCLDISIGYGYFGKSWGVGKMILKY
jgi:hypothetical protein